METNTNTPVYGGYHPNDLGVGWFGSYRIDSALTIGFFNSVAMKTSRLVHAVNRGELIFRVSDGGFSMQAIRVRIGITMVLKAWRNEPDTAHADIIRQDITIGVSGTILEDTMSWLQLSWSTLQSLIDQRLPSLVLPEFLEILPDETVTSGLPPLFTNDYDGVGEASSYEEPSNSSESGDLPDFNTDA